MPFRPLPVLLSLTLLAAEGALGHAIQLDFTAPVGVGNRADGGTVRIGWTDSPDPTQAAIVTVLATRRSLSIVDLRDGGGDLLLGTAAVDDETDSLDWDTAGVPEGCYQPYAVVSDPDGRDVRPARGSITVGSGPNVPPAVWISNPEGDRPEPDGTFVVRVAVDEPDDTSWLTIRRFDGSGAPTVVASDLEVPDGGGTASFRMDVKPLPPGAYRLHAEVVSADGRRCDSHWPSWLFVSAGYDSGSIDSGSVDSGGWGSGDAAAGDADDGGEPAASAPPPSPRGCGCTAHGAALAGAAILYSRRRPRPGAKDAAARTAVERLADFVANLRWEDVPALAREKARLQLLSVAGAIYASRHSQAASAVRRAVLSWNKPGPCTVLPTGERTALHEAVLANAAASMALDFDDYLLMGHTGHSSVLASLALAEQERLSGRDFLLAAVAANEVAGRVGASVLLGPQNGQCWSFIHAASAAAAGAKLLGLDARRTAHALAIALYQPTFTLWPGFMGPGSKVLTAAQPAVVGLQAAQFAREGLTGAPDLFESARRGFWASFSFTPLPSLTGGLGEAWLTETLAYKPYPGCAYLDTALDALFAALSEASPPRAAPPAEEVRGVDIAVSMLSLEMDNLVPDLDGAPTEIACNFSLRLTAAIALLAGRLTGAELAREFLEGRSSEILAVAKRVRVRHDWRLTGEVVRAFRGVLGSEVDGLLRSPRRLGAVWRGLRREARGQRRNPLRVGALMTRHLPGLLAELFKGVGRAFNPAPLGWNLGGFRWVFPAEVLLTLADGRSFRARRDVPLGAPGDPSHLEVPERKWRIEAGGVLPPERLERAVELVRKLETATAAEIALALSAPPGELDSIQGRASKSGA
ncbi:MAG: MmgE/PrpD family protein [Myxococcales bacterium]|nr:MmgE/PrpD family protein [Myxococcales bacterium]